jgi:thiol-disulfide isomerase/thioredoxin
VTSDAADLAPSIRSSSTRVARADRAFAGGLAATIAVAALALGAAGCGRKRVEPPAGDILADLTALPTVDGHAFDAKPLYARDVLVMFYSPTCGHCTREMPEAVAAAEKSGSAIVAVMVGGTTEQAQELAVADRLSSPVLLDDGQLRRKYDIRAVPYTLVLASGGRAARAFIGAQGEDRLASALRDARD